MTPCCVAASLSVGEFDKIQFGFCSPANAFANPKSSTFTLPSGVTLILAGFRSRWITPFSWAASRASAICRASFRDSSTGIGPRLDPIRQRLAFHQFQDKEVCSAGFFQPVNGGNVRMIERGEQLGFALEPGNAIGVLGELFRQNLDRHIPAELWSFA